MTAALYLNMLEEFLVPILKEQGPNHVLFQQDGAERLRLFSLYSYFGFVGRKFSWKWIGRGGPVTWPPCYSDLTPRDVFWGYIKILFTF